MKIKSAYINFRLISSLSFLCGPSYKIISWPIHSVTLLLTFNHHLACFVLSYDRNRAEQFSRLYISVCTLCTVHTFLFFCFTDIQYFRFFTQSVTKSYTRSSKTRCFCKFVVDLPANMSMCCSLFGYLIFILWYLQACSTDRRPYCIEHPTSDGYEYEW